MKKPVTLAVVGAGSRGRAYARYAAAFPGQAQVVAVAEPRDHYRQAMAREHRVTPENVFRDWAGLAARPRLAAAALICTSDALHTAPAVALARRGYHLLLEKPMAPRAAECRRIVAAVERHRVILAVCHVLRYRAYTRRLKQMIAAGLIGQVMHIDQLEPVGYWHQAHSFIRGNWRNSRESSPMLLAKSCHDLDFIRHLVGAPCRRVASFGSLVHFRPENRPAGAADRCLDCAVEATCPYSACRIYLSRLEAGHLGWPLDVLTTDLSRAGVTAALRDGPYGRCVYACDNDVVDHQVVNMEFAGGATAAFTMTGFTKSQPRRTRVFGTRGELRGDSERIVHYDFLTGKTRTIRPRTAATAGTGGHGGGDHALMAAFVRAVGRGDPAPILSGPRETLETHLMVFAAEQARTGGRVVTLPAAPAPGTDPAR